MIENDIFIKKCKNCERFFIPKRRADAEYCERSFGENGRKCSEVGAMLRYEKKVAENPILEAHKRAYRRLNSRARAKKMSQAEFLKRSSEASRKRDECMAGTLPFIVNCSFYYPSPSLTSLTNLTQPHSALPALPTSLSLTQSYRRHSPNLRHCPKSFPPYKARRDTRAIGLAAPPRGRLAA